jgi:cell wall-associated NlpC family hydrolase
MRNQEIITEARLWKGTRWMHGQALRGVGTDCIQFLISIAKKFMLVPQDYKPPAYTRDYALHNDVSLMKQEISKFCFEVKDMQSGDIILYKVGKCASHAGIYVGGNKVIHSHIKQGVIEDELRNIKFPVDSVWRFNVHTTD